MINYIRKLRNNGHLSIKEYIVCTYNRRKVLLDISNGFLVYSSDKLPEYQILMSSVKGSSPVYKTSTKITSILPLSVERHRKGTEIYCKPADWFLARI